MALGCSLEIVFIGFAVIFCVCDSSPTTKYERESSLLRMKRWEQCETSIDCGQDECCVALRNSPNVRACKKRPQLGKSCRPNILPGLSNACPCSIGLTCALTSMDNFGRHDVFRCVLVPEQEKEVEARRQ